MDPGQNGTTHSDLFTKSPDEIDNGMYMKLITLVIRISSNIKSLTRINEGVGGLVFNITPAEKRRHTHLFSELEISMVFSDREIENMRTSVMQSTQMQISNEQWVLLIHHYEYDTARLCNKYFDIMGGVDGGWHWERLINDLVVKNKYAIEKPIYGQLTVAVFYNSYSYLKGLIQLLKKREFHTQFKLTTHLSMVKIREGQVEKDSYDLSLDIFTKKEYILSVYDQLDIPIFLIDILTFHTKLDNHNYEKVQINENYEHELKYTYKREPFEHQKRNIAWMINKENEIKSNHDLKTFHMGARMKIFPVREIDDYLYVDECTRQLVNTAELEQVSIEMRGGVLCDDVGLGKTMSMVGLIAESLSSARNPSLVICPCRLCNQWKEEIKLTCDMRTVVVANINQYRSFIKSQIKNYDVVIFSYNMFANAKYTNQVAQDGTFDFCDFSWGRVIFDELHEHINYKLFKRKISRNPKVLISILKLKAEYIWISSGTPYFDNTSFNLILLLLTKVRIHTPNGTWQDPDAGDLNYTNKKKCDLYLEYVKFVTEHGNNITAESGHDWDSITELLGEFERRYSHLYEKISASIFRKSKLQVHVCDVPEPIITTQFLEPDPIEKCMYDCALDDKKDMVKMCSHIMVGADCEKIIGTKIMSLDQIHKKMVSHYETSIRKIQGKLSRLLVNLEHNMGCGDTSSDAIPTNAVTLCIYETTANQLEDICRITRLPDFDDAEHSEVSVLMKKYTTELKTNMAKHSIFTHLDKNLKENNTCPICFEDFESTISVVLSCTHVFCLSCVEKCVKSKNDTCSICREKIDKRSYSVIKPNADKTKLGTKIEFLMNWLKSVLECPSSKVIIFSQWDSMLKILKSVLEDHAISHVFVNGPLSIVSSRIRKFKLDPSVRVVLLSSDKASSGLNLQEASHVVLYDTINNAFTEKQAIGRCVRIGQKKSINVLRLIMRHTIEEEIFNKYNQKPCSSSNVIPT
tara:strand:- start:701 stop:3625 length:2925 start_codon:yes stop_codon:yes gene_type:complete